MKTRRIALLMAAAVVAGGFDGIPDPVSHSIGDGESVQCLRPGCDKLFWRTLNSNRAYCSGECCKADKERVKNKNKETSNRR